MRIIKFMETHNPVPYMLVFLYIEVIIFMLIMVYAVIRVTTP